MFDSFSLLVLIPIFIVGAVAVWIAGIQLSKTTDIIDERFHLGEALGGLIVLAIVTNLPEIAITISAAVTNNLSLAIGNILGGIGIQTVVLVILDIVKGKKGPSLMRGAASLELVLEASLVIGVLTLAIMGTQLSPSWTFARLDPAGILLLAAWLIGLWLLSKARNGLPWQDHGRAPDTVEPESSSKSDAKKARLGRALLIFGVSALVTLVAGVLLEESGNAIAGKVGLSGVFFGATFLAAATALPELSTGIEAVKLKDYELAVSDIFGGNSFLPVLFLVAGLFSGQAVLPKAGHTDIYLAGLGILLTTIYLWGLIFRPQRQFLRMGLDSLTVLIVYIVGIVGLLGVPQH